MKKIAIFFFLLFSTTVLKGEYVFYDIGINIGFSTFQLLTDNRSTQEMFLYGGGLSYIEPGIDISTTLFLDSIYTHRLVGGLESHFMAVKEIKPESSNAYRFSHHQVTTTNIFIGYHYAFYKAP